MTVYSDNCTLCNHKNLSKSRATCTFNTQTTESQCIFFRKLYVCGDGVYSIYYHNADRQCKCLFISWKINLLFLYFIPLLFSDGACQQLHTTN